MTPHINAKQGEIAKIVLMPGDPLRAKSLANKFLSNVKQVNNVRNVLMFTGKYNGKNVSICGSGMGQPSIAIYAYELFKFYNVENIIRVGSAGAYKKDLKLYELVLATEVYSDSKIFNKMAGVIGHLIKPSKILNLKIKKVAKKIGVKLHEARIHTSDTFYDSRSLEETIKITKADCVEMESSALFATAKMLGKQASTILTISDNLISGAKTSFEKRQNNFIDMFKVALSIV